MVVPEQSINNIMGGLESTGGVTLHNHRRKLRQRFDIVKKLGQGTYGKVQLGMNKETNQAVAIKTIKKCKIQTEADLIRIRREIQIMSSLRHPYIIHIYEVFENKDKIVLVMEYAAGGELYDYLNTQKALDEGEARRIFRQIAMAVFYCHKYQICHRDLKLENILLDENGNAKIADFGLSNVFDKSRLLSTFCGSPLYASPEIVRGIPYIGPEVDCWSLGVLLYTLVYRAMPFDGSNFKRLVMLISIGAYFEPKDDKSSASGVIRSLLTVNPNTRFTIADVCKDPWMNEEGKVSCYRLAEELALEPPNRLDLLLALATPPQTDVAAEPEEASLGPSQESAPPRSMSLGNLSTVQHSATYTAVSTAGAQSGEPAEDKVKPAAEKKSGEEKERKRDRSRSKSRKKEVGTDETKKKSSRTKKKSAEEIPSKEELKELLDDALKITSELSVKADDKSTSEDVATGVDQVADVKKVESVEPELEVVETAKEIPQENKIQPKPEEEAAVTPVEKEEKVDKTVKESPSVTRVGNEVRRKSEAFEQGDLIAPTENSKKRDVHMPRRGVSVSDTRAAFERRSSADVRTSPTKRASPQPVKKPEFALASSVNVADIVKAELGNEADTIIASNVEPPTRPVPLTEEPVKKDEEVKLKKENAIKVISHAISESELNEKKASTLPRRRLSKPSVSQPTSAEPQRMAPSTKVSQFVYPSVSPVPAPRPSLIKQESAPCAPTTPKERIIPIFVEKREAESAGKDRSQQVSRQGSVSSSARSSTSSLGRQDSTSSTLSASTSTTTATTTAAEPIRKSPREVIIPIAVEGGGIVTPSEQTLSKMSSTTLPEEDDTASIPLRSFGLHSTRPHQLDSADSVSSDEDDDNFEMLSTENLFSTLLTRMRNLTQNLDHGRPNFPRLFHHPLFEPRRLTETKSFSSDADPTPWRRKSSTNMASSSATLPRGFTNKPFRRLQNRDDLPPPAASISTARRINRTVSDSFQNGFDSAKPLIDDPIVLAASTSRLSSLERVKRYLDDMNRSEFRRPCRSVYVPGTSQTSEFEKFRQTSRCNGRVGGGGGGGGGGVAVPGPVVISRGPSLNAYDKIKELREYHNNRRSLMEDKSNENEPPLKKDEAKSVLEKYLYGEPKPKKQSRFLSKPDGNKKKEESRVDKTIKALRRNSIGFENAFSESKLLKRAVSLEDISVEAQPASSVNNRNKRASSLKPEDSSSPPFEKKEVASQRKKTFDAINAAKEKLKLDLLPHAVPSQFSFNSAESTPTGGCDVDDTQSFASNSDTWSSSDPTERFFDAAEDCVSERIRRKSFYHRFNLPKRNGSYHRSDSY